MLKCNQCGDSKNNLGNHWRLSSECSYPKVSDKNIDILTGILMGDGRSDKLEQMFIEQGIDANPTKSKNLNIGVEHTEKFFNLIGEPIDAFNYKWP